MDEQTIQQQPQQQSSSYDVSADGAAYSGYDDEPLQQSNEALETTEAEQVQDDNGLPSDGISVKDGEVEYSDDFFGDIPKEEAEEVHEEPKYYSNDELKNTPFEQWDKNRLQGDVRDFYPIVQEQIRQRNARQAVQQAAQNMQNAPMPEFMAEPKHYTPHELAEEAKKLACEKLGIDDPSDYDNFEEEHQAAFSMAMQELVQKNWSDSQAYERGKSEWQQLQRFNAELAAQPDFNDFNQWYMNALQARGLTHDQVNNYLYQTALKNGNRFSLIGQMIGNWYREYRQSKGTQGLQQRGKQNARAKTPVQLEGTGGNAPEMRRRVDMSRFGELDDDAQAEALMRMGIV